MRILKLRYPDKSLADFVLNNDPERFTLKDVVVAARTIAFGIPHFYKVIPVGVKGAPAILLGHKNDRAPFAPGQELDKIPLDNPDFWHIVTVSGADREAFDAVRFDADGLPWQGSYHKETINQSFFARQGAPWTVYLVTESLVGTTEIAKALGVSRQAVSKRVARGTMPTPKAHLAAGPVWEVNIDFLKWLLAVI